MGADASMPEQKSGTPVILHVYGLFKSKVGTSMNEVLSHFNIGAFHVGVEVYGKEWSYGASHPGVFAVAPRGHSGHAYQESISMGHTTKSAAEVMLLLRQFVKEEWASQHYDLLRHNCVNFSEAFCRHLGVSPIPQHITSLAEVGASIFHPVQSVGVLLGHSARQNSKGSNSSDNETVQAAYYGRHRTFSDDH